MDGISSGGGLPASLSAEGTINVTLLKKSQNLMETQAAALLAALPEAGAMPPSPPGVGGRVDLRA
jgi:hypothetical protein